MASKTASLQEYATEDTKKAETERKYRVNDSSRFPNRLEKQNQYPVFPRTGILAFLGASSFFSFLLCVLCG
jgi:hypothetical protein